MTPEKFVPAPRELNFYGEGKASDIKLGYAITSLRNPRPDYEFRRGERILANCADDGEKIPVIVITNEEKKLKDFSISQLAMDGFFSVEQTIDGMKVYPGYENINQDSPLKAITFVLEKSYLELPKATKQWASRFGFDDIVWHPKLRHLFLPTMCFHLASSGGNLYDWGCFLRDHVGILDFEYNGVIGAGLKSEIFKHSEKLLEILQEPDSGFFKRLVLGLTY